jgi:hypothetical protein
MPHVDAILADDEIIAAVHQALAQRLPNSRRRGRLGFSAEIVLRLLILKHLCNWSYQMLEREVRANLVSRDFTRVGSEKMPDAKTMGRWGIALGRAVIQQIQIVNVLVMIASRAQAPNNVRVAFGPISAAFPSAGSRRAAAVTPRSRGRPPAALHRRTPKSRGWSVARGVNGGLRGH